MSDDYTSTFGTNILVIDGNETSLDFLTEVLSNQGYVAHPVSDGSRALSSAMAELPDLIILDIMLPEVNGYQVCQQLKADERTCDIPVIFPGVNYRMNT